MSPTYHFNVQTCQVAFPQPHSEEPSLRPVFGAAYVFGPGFQPSLSGGISPEDLMRKTSHPPAPQGTQERHPSFGPFTSGLC